MEADMNICVENGKRCMSRREAGELVNKFHRHHNCCKKYPRRVYLCVSCGTYHVTSQKYFIAQ